MKREIIENRFAEMALIFRINLTPEGFKGLISSWERLLKEEKVSDFEDFCDNHLMTSKYFPVPADYFSKEGRKTWWNK